MPDRGLIVADVSVHGRLEPTPHVNSDLLALAAGGLLSVNSTAPSDPTSTPLRYRGELSSVHAALGVVITVLGALFERRQSGLGEHIDVSAQAAVAAIMATAVPNYSYTGDVAVHDGRRGVFPWGFYACTDGHVLIQITEDSQWRSLLDILGNPEWGDWDVFTTTAQRTENADVLNPMVAEAIATFSAADFLAACHAHGVAASLIHTAKDLLEWEHLRDRGFFESIAVAGHDRGEDAAVEVPGRPWRYHVNPAPPRGVGPRLGTSTADDVARSWPARTAPASETARPLPPARRPLEGVKVVDLTWVWAGPYATMQLAHLGAEVVKIEAPDRLDVTRQLAPWADGIAGPNRSGYFNQYNQGKQSVRLDLKHPDGLRVLRALLAEADVVIDNMRAGALARMGFPYEVLRSINPRIVAVTMTGFGESGPERDRMAYGSIIDALSGIASANGPVGGGPTDFAMSLPDPCAGAHAAIATMGALYRAQATGVGEQVECTMLEASIAAFPWPVLHQGVTGGPPPVIGNRDERRAPHDVYPCAGHYQWVAVAVETDAQWAALARTIGREDLAADPRVASLAGRQHHADELDAAISAWTSTLDPTAAADRLRAAGVPAERVHHIDDLFASKALLARNFFIELPHPEIGTKPLGGVGWRTERTPMVVTSTAPCLGADTEAVLRRWLGFTHDDVAALAAAGVTR
jgi:crotonobetainyl-CoA:carnitine CoA-transferase CaiB-like acyl-CoA transferase